MRQPIFNAVYAMVDFFSTDNNSFRLVAYEYC